MALALAAGMLVATGCSDGDSSDEPEEPVPEEPKDDDKPKPDDKPDDKPKPRPVVAFGDSLTAGSALPAARPYPARVAAQKGIEIINRGIPGQSSNRGVREFEAVLRLNPRLVLVLLGTNDVIGNHNLDGAKENLRQIIRGAKGIGARAIIATIPPMIGDMERFMPRVDYLNGLIRALAREEMVPLVDLAYEFGGGEMLLLPDGFHPNETGTQVIAFAFAKSF